MHVLSHATDLDHKTVKVFGPRFRALETGAILFLMSIFDILGV